MLLCVHFTDADGRRVLEYRGFPVLSEAQTSFVQIQFLFPGTNFLFYIQVFCLFVLFFSVQCSSQKDNFSAN